MMRSLFAGVSGLKSHQTRMDVIGNNIANVNTTGYKSKTLNFSDMLYQTTQAASGPNANAGTGGINPRQIGLGVKTAAINTSITTEGASQSTGNPFDLKLKGEAFFVVSDGTNTYYTRDGSFDVDKNGNLCMASTGYIVQGWSADEEGNIIKGSVGDINIMSKGTYTAAATTKATISGILDSNDSTLDTENGRLLNLAVYDSAGYEYNLKFGILPVTNPVQSERQINNVENEYTLAPNLYQVDTSKLTYNYTLAGSTGSKELKTTDMPTELLEKLEKAIWATVNGTTPTGVTLAGITNNRGTNFGTSQENAVTVDLNAFITANTDLDAAILAGSELRAMTLNVDFSGGLGYTKTATVDYPLNNIDTLSISDELASVIYNTTGTPTNGVKTCALQNANFATITSVQQTYTDDNGNTVTDYKFKDASSTPTNPVYITGITEEMASDALKLLGFAGTTDSSKQNQYGSTEQKTDNIRQPGQFTISLIGMTDSAGADVNIDALKNNGTTSWNLVYNPTDRKFSYVGSAGNDTFTVNLSGVSVNGVTGALSDVTIDVSDTSNQDNEGKSTVEGLKDDGMKQGNLQGVSIGTNGTVTAKYTNGMTMTLGQICVGTFANSMGLENVGDSLYTSSANSGECRYEDIEAAGIGNMTSGVLEMSNVDLSQEFTDMITTQRGFQANSRIITTSDTLLEELVNLKR